MAADEVDDAVGASSYATASQDDHSVNRAQTDTGSLLQWSAITCDKLQCQRTCHHRRNDGYIIDYALKRCSLLVRKAAARGV